MAVESTSPGPIPNPSSDNVIQANYVPAILVAAMLGFVLGYLFGKAKKKTKSIKGGHG